VKSISEKYSMIDGNFENKDVKVASLLQKSRSLIAEGKPNQALENVIEAIRMTQGEGAIMKILDVAKQNAVAQRNHEIENSGTKINEKFYLAEAIQASSNLLQQESILSDMGDGSEIILKQAFEDGSSVICQRCNGLVSRVRWISHCDYWCPAISDIDD
jgi:hypothetical protein